MVTAVSPSTESQGGSTAEDKPGVAPLRAGQGHEFLLRRLHSLSGIVPVGVFLLEHILYSNAQAIGGPLDYALQVKFLGSLPLVFFLELFGIWLPIAFHGLYGFWIWYRGTANLISYPWAGNWMYSLQRWTGGIAFAYIIVHTYTLRFSGTDLHDNPAAAFGKVQRELSNVWYFVFYIIGLLAASWHLAYGIWLFLCKWGIVIGERARRRALVASLGLFMLVSVVGLAALYRLKTTPQQPVEDATFEKLERAERELKRK